MPSVTREDELQLDSFSKIEYLLEFQFSLLPVISAE